MSNYSVIEITINIIILSRVKQSIFEINEKNYINAILSINERGSDWALYSCNVNLQKNVYFMLLIFSFFNRESPYFQGMINLITRQRSSRPHMRTVRNSFTNFSLTESVHTYIHIYIHTHTYTRAEIYEMYTDVTKGLLDGISEQTMLGAKREKRRRTRNEAAEREVDGGRGGGGGSSTSSTWRNEPTHTRAFALHTPYMRAGRLTLQADRPGNLFLPEVAPFSCILEPFENPFERTAKFRTIRRRTWVTRIISVANITHDFPPNYALFLFRCRSQ